MSAARIATAHVASVLEGAAEMTKRATFTQAEIARAIRAADKAGKVAVQMRDGIVFVSPDAVTHDAATSSGGNTCDEAFGTGEP